MSLSSQNLSRCSCHLQFFTHSIHRNTPFSLSFPHGCLTNLPQFHFHIHHLQTPRNLSSLRNRPCSIGDFEFEEAAQIRSRDGGFNLDSLLSFSELLCLFSSAVLSAGFVVNFFGSSSKKTLRVLIGDKGSVWVFPLLVAAVFLNSWIRRLQWRRMCGKPAKGAAWMNLLERIEKLEEDSKSSTTVIQVLSRKLEKLGTSFRVTRRDLKDPISETAALAQRTTEATQIVAAQRDDLEKELIEMQKVLMAMQEQQQKQLELIIAVAEKSRLMESKHEVIQQQTMIEKRNFSIEASKELETYEI